MRIKREKVDIDYDKTKIFFEARGKKYNEEHPYVTTMYQDQHPQLTDERNREETAKILPQLQLDETSRVLDLGCGIGRWADCIPASVAFYLGIDFSESLIQIARSRNAKNNFAFQQMSLSDFGAYYRSISLPPFNRLIIAGVFTYLNDEDVENVLRFLEDILSPEAIVYIREPVGIHERLTLKDFYSQELAHDYNVIYRSVEEYRHLIKERCPAFVMMQEEFLFDTPALNNRKETSQYYFILRKEGGR